MFVCRKTPFHVVRNRLYVLLPSKNIQDEILEYKIEWFLKSLLHNSIVQYYGFETNQNKIILFHSNTWFEMFHKQNTFGFEYDYFSEIIKIMN